MQCGCINVIWAHVNVKSSAYYIIELSDAYIYLILDVFSLNRSILYGNEFYSADFINRCVNSGESLTNLSLHIDKIHKKVFLIIPTLDLNSNFPKGC